MRKSRAEDEPRERVRPAQKRGRSPLEHSSLGEAGDLGSRYDQMIEDADFDQVQSLAEAAGHEFISVRGFAHTRRMVMRLMCP